MMKIETYRYFKMLEGSLLRIILIKYANVLTFVKITFYSIDKSCCKSS